MAGFDIGTTTAVLEFDQGTALEGATVRVSLDMSVRDFLALQRRIAQNDAEAVGNDMEDLFTQFAKNHLVSWDLARGDEAIPATVDGFLSLPFNAAAAIFGAWMQALGGPGPNSVAASASFDTSAAG